MFKYVENMVCVMFEIPGLQDRQILELLLFKVYPEVKTELIPQSNISASFKFLAMPFR